MTSIKPRPSGPVNQPPDQYAIMVNVFGRTDVGRTREHNEDAFVVADLTANDASLQPSVRKHKVGAKGSLFMVADGMGGAAAGEIASQMAIETVISELRENWIQAENASPDAFAICLRKAAQVANQKIHGYASSHQEYRGMGTTATIAGLLADTLYLAQIGDSRGYLVREGVARQITKDQSLMQKLIEAGELTEEEAAMSERRNIILQALGPEPNIKVDLTFQRLRRGDTLVLCSDGLSGQVSRDEIAQVIAEEPDLVQACRKLIDKANQAGGPDNITVIIARFDGEGLTAEGLEGDDVRHRVFATSDARETTAPMAMPRSNDITQPMRASSPNATPPSTPVVDADADAPALIPHDVPEDDPNLVPTDPVITAVDRDSMQQNGVDADAPTLQVLPQRRSRGMAVAIVLLILLIAFGAWYAYTTFQKVQPEPTPATPAVTTP
jgi:serine/threonine protein phosphatase PrpC